MGVLKVQIGVSRLYIVKAVYFPLQMRAMCTVAKSACFGMSRGALISGYPLLYYFVDAAQEKRKAWPCMSQPPPKKQREIKVARSHGCL